MTKAYQIPIILLIPANSYEEALQQASDIVDLIEMDSSIGVRLETEFERDGSEENQRVLYLHDENKPIDLDDG